LEREIVEVAGKDPILPKELHDRQSEKRIILAIREPRGETHRSDIGRLSTKEKDNPMKLGLEKRQEVKGRGKPVPMLLPRGNPRIVSWISSPQSGPS